MIQIPEQDLPEALRLHDAVDDPPDSERYILLYFENYSLPQIGRFYDGCYYLGDELESCLSYDLYVSGWREILAEE